MSEVMARMSGVRRSFGSVVVLDGLDLTLDRGEVLALLGPNGAGKTTAIRILTTQLRAEAGEVTVAGYDAASDPLEVRRRIGLTGQQVALDQRQTGRENLAMLARLAGLGRAAARSRTADLLADFGLTTAGDRRVETYSGGMRRRLDLAGALIVRPAVLFLDEPTTGLDPRSRLMLWESIRAVVAEVTSLFLTTQYLEEADQLADRIAVLDGGRVVAQGTASELKAQVGGARLELTLPDPAGASVVAAALGLPRADLTGERTVSVGTDGSLGHVRSLLEAVESTGVVPQTWSVREPTLDEVFLTLTGHQRNRGAEHTSAAVA